MEQSNSKKFRPNDPVGNLLRGVRCDSVLFPSKFSDPVVVSSNDNLGEAFRKLIDNQILAAPILDSISTEVISVISMVDILNILVDEISERELELLKNKDDPLWQTMYARLLSRKDAIVHTKMAELLDRKVDSFKFLDPVYKLKFNEPVMRAVEIMVEKKAHRVIITDDRNRFTTFITQSRVLELVSTILHAVPEAHQTLSDMKLQGLAIKDIATVKSSDMVFKAFKMMKEKGVSGVGVVDELNHVVGNISVNDLKLLDFDLTFISMLGTTAKEYMEVISHPESLHMEKKPIRNRPLRKMLAGLERPIITCSMRDSLVSVISVVNHYHIHRVFVEDETGHAIGVLSLHDILDALLNIKKAIVTAD